MILWSDILKAREFYRKEREARLKIEMLKKKQDEQLLAINKRQKELQLRYLNNNNNNRGRE